MTRHNEFGAFVGEDVVIDISPPISYIGRLVDAGEFFLTLANVDLHDLRDGNTSKEVYVMEIARNGIQPNRKEVKIKQSEIISLSKLSDVIIY